MQQGRASQVIEHLSGQMLRSAISAGRISQDRFGLLLQNLFQILNIRAVSSHDHGGHKSYIRNRRKVFFGFEAQVTKYARIDGKRAIGHQQGVAVSAGISYRPRTNIAAGTRSVVDNNGLAQRSFQPGAQFAGQQVGPAARRKGDDHGNRLEGIFHSLLGCHLPCLRRWITQA